MHWGAGDSPGRRSRNLHLAIWFGAGGVAIESCCCCSQEPAGIVCWQYILAEVSFHFKVLHIIGVEGKVTYLDFPKGRL